MTTEALLSIVQLRSHLIAARAQLLSAESDSTTPLRAKMGVATALSAIGADREALLLYASVLTDRPGHKAARRALCRSASAMGLPGDPDRKMTEAQRVAYQIDLARACLKQGDLENAKGLFACVLARYPENLPAHVGLIDVALRTDDPNNAVKLARQGLERAPRETSLGLRLALGLQRTGRIEEATALLKDMNERKPGHPLIATRLARAYLAAGKTSAVRRLVRNGLSKKSAVLLQAELDERAGDLEPALRRLARMVEAPGSSASEQSPAILTKFCALCLLTGQMDRARKALQKADLEIDQFSPAQLLKLMQIAFKAGANEITASVLETVLSRTIVPRELALQILMLVHASGQPGPTARIRDALAQRVDASHRDAFRIDSDVMTLGADVAIVRARSTGASRRSPIAAKSLSRALQQAGLPKLLFRYLKFCKFRWPDDLEFTILLADAYRSFGQPKEALRLLDDLNQAFATNTIRRRLRILFESDRINDLERLLEETGTQSLKVLSPRQRVMICIKRDRVNEVLAMASEVAAETSQDYSVMSQFSVTHIGALLNELRIYRVAHDAASTPPTAGSNQLFRSFFLPAKQVIDKAWPGDADATPVTNRSDIPKRVFQYWNSEMVPVEVDRVMTSWKKATGYRHNLMNRAEARMFLRETFDTHHETAFRMANHVAEECDFLRLCLLLARGGIYADADDRLIGDLDRLRGAGCGIVLFREPMIGAIANNLILARPGHPLLQIAVDMARDSLLSRENDSTWSKTGPGLMTRATAAYLTDTPPDDVVRDFALLPRHVAQSVVQFHVRLPYKSTKAYWNSRSGLVATQLLRSIEHHV